MGIKKERKKERKHKCRRSWLEESVGNCTNLWLLIWKLRTRTSSSTLQTANSSFQFLHECMYRYPIFFFSGTIQQKIKTLKHQLYLCWEFSVFVGQLLQNYLGPMVRPEKPKKRGFEPKVRSNSNTANGFNITYTWNYGH